MQVNAFGSDHYVPILLTKRGELSALRTTPNTVKSVLTPLFVVHPVDWDYPRNQPAKSVTAHLAKLPAALLRAWGTDRAIVDLTNVGDADLSGGLHPLEWLTGQTAALGLMLIPAIAVNSSSTYRQAAARVTARDGEGACLRLTVNDWPSNAGLAALNSLMADLAVTAGACDLVLDLGDEVGDAARAAVAAEIRSLPYLKAWRSLTVAGTAMPQAMPAGPHVHRISRREWTSFKRLVNSGRLLRTPTFGDYAISHPRPQSLDGRIINISGSLRYTSGDEWLVSKGGPFKASGGRSLGGAAMIPALQALSADSGYLGAGHCATEQWVDEVLTRHNGGNPERWRQEGTRHHLHVVTEQIAILAAASSAA